MVATGDSWTNIAMSCLKRKAIDFECIEIPTYQDYMNNGYSTVGCGPHFEGVLYFYSYFLLMNLILMKLFIAIILEAYEDIKKQEAQIFNEDRLESFNLTWQKYDPDVRGP